MTLLIKFLSAENGLSDRAHRKRQVRKGISTFVLLPSFFEKCASSIRQRAYHISLVLLREQNCMVIRVVSVCMYVCIYGCDIHSRYMEM